MALALPPRFWQTGAFRVGAVVAALLLVLAVARWRLALLVRQQRRLEGLVGERTRDLAEAKRELEQANATLEERVDAAVRSLREAERMAAYGQMVAGVAHEVRQPIFALGMAAHVIGQTFAGREDVARQVALVQRETRRVNAIMDELLDFARPAELVKAPLRPKTVLAEAADIFNAEHGAAVAVTVDVDPELPPVPLDEARMVQVLVNLMGNARKHAAGLTRIVLRGAMAGGRLRLEVENDGAGIPAGDLPQIFSHSSAAAREGHRAGAGDRAPDRDRARRRHPRRVGGGGDALHNRAAGGRGSVAARLRRDRAEGAGTRLRFFWASAVHAVHAPSPTSLAAVPPPLRCAVDL